MSDLSSSTASRRARLGRLLVTLAGLGLGAYLVVNHGWHDVLSALRAVGWGGLTAITVFHAVPTLLCGLAWWVLLRPHLDDGWFPYFWLRWIRDGTDGVIPILPVSGELVATRILNLRGTAFAGAGVIVDVTAELFGQLLFAVLGFVLLIATHPASHYKTWIGLGIGVMVVQFGGFYIAQKKGLFRLIERPLEWLRRRRRASAPEPIESEADRTLHEQILQLHARHGIFAGSVALHLVAWVAGALEVWMALQLMGHPLDFTGILVIESLVCATRSVTFFVPLNAGVQEAAFVLVGSLIGLPADLALAVSLIKRARDMLKGLPALLVWQLIERRGFRRGAGGMASGRSV